MNAPIEKGPEQNVQPLPKTSITVGSIWMVGITLALFFLPLINGLIGGVVGGYKVGAVSRALVAAILPAVVLAMSMWVIFALFDAPAWGILAGATAGVLVALADLGIFVGAAIGGAIARRAHAR